MTGLVSSRDGIPTLLLTWGISGVQASCNIVGSSVAAPVQLHPNVPLDGTPMNARRELAGCDDHNMHVFERKKYRSIIKRESATGNLYLHHCTLAV